MDSTWRDRIALVAVLAVITGVAVYALVAGGGAADTAVGAGSNETESPEPTVVLTGTTTGPREAPSIPTTVDLREFHGDCGGTGVTTIPCVTQAPVPPPDDLVPDYCSDEQDGTTICAYTTTGPPPPPVSCGGTAVTTIPCGTPPPLDEDPYCAAINQTVRATGAEYAALLELSAALAPPEHARMWELLLVMDIENFSYENFNPAADEVDGTMPDIEGMCAFSEQLIELNDEGHLTISVESP